MSAFRWVALGHREIADMITSLICHGTLTRFPELRIASVENGSAWIHPLFHDFGDIISQDAAKLRRSIRSMCSVATSGSARSGKARCADVVATVGWDRVLFGSDYPHPEGLAEPKGFYKYAEGMDDAGPTTSWATTPAASSVCRSPTPTQTP